MTLWNPISVYHCAGYAEETAPGIWESHPDRNRYLRGVYFRYPAVKGGKYHEDVMCALPPCRIAEELKEVQDFIRSRKGVEYIYN